MTAKQRTGLNKKRGEARDYRQKKRRQEGKQQARGGAETSQGSCAPTIARSSFRTTSPWNDARRHTRKTDTTTTQNEDTEGGRDDTMSMDEQDPVIAKTQGLGLIAHIN